VAKARILVGVIFIITGWPKLLDIQQTQGFFVMLGLPRELAVVIGLLEVIFLFQKDTK